LKAVVLQSNYIPWKGYFDLINEADTFIFYDEVKYTKNDWRNRNKLLDKNDEFWLTIPISKLAVKQKISEVALPNNGWQIDHYNTIMATYHNAPEKINLQPLLKQIYIENSWHYLSELNQYIIKAIARYIGLKTKFIQSADYNLNGDKISRLISLIEQVGDTEYITGPAAKNYLKDSESLFYNRNIKLTYKEYGPYKTYPQNKYGFTNFVSIIDLLMSVKKDHIIQYLNNLNSGRDSVQ